MNSDDYLKQALNETFKEHEVLLICLDNSIKKTKSTINDLRSYFIWQGRLFAQVCEGSLSYVEIKSVRRIRTFEGDGE